MPALLRGPSPDEVRKALIESRRYMRVVERAEQRAMASTTLEVSKWSPTERWHAVQWARGDRASAPDPLRRYLRKIAPDLEVQ